MCRGGKYKNGNPKRASRFICCKCLKDNHVGDGIQRGGHQREKGTQKISTVSIVMRLHAILRLDGETVMMK